MLTWKTWTNLREVWLKSGLTADLDR